MGYAIRFFMQSPVDSLLPILNTMHRAGYRVKIVGIEAFDFYYAPDVDPLTAGLLKAVHPATQSEVAIFIEIVSQRPSYRGQHEVLNTLSRTRTMIALGVPDDFTAYGDGHLLSLLMDSIDDLGDGMFHIHGQGFFVGNALIYPMH